MGRNIIKRFGKKVLTILDKNSKLPWVQQLMLQNKIVGKENTVLDVGCGIGNSTLYLKYEKIVGIDAFEYKEKYLETHPKSEFVKGILPGILKDFETQSFDVVVALDLIEHMEKELGFELIEEMERIAKKKVFFLTPSEWDDNVKHVEDENVWSHGNPYNIHKSLWSKDDFLCRNYRILADPKAIPKNSQGKYIFALKILK